MYKKLLLILITLSTMHSSIAMDMNEVVDVSSYGKRRSKKSGEKILTLINESPCRVECTFPNGYCLYLEPQYESWAVKKATHPQSGLMNFKEDNYYSEHPRWGSYAARLHINKTTTTIKIRLSHNGYECCLPFFRRYWLDVQTEEDHSVQFTADGDPSD